MELVQDMHQVLMDREDTCHRTCFSMHLNGTTLDNFAELKSIEALKEGVTIQVVEEPYSVREAKNHLKHVQDLLRSIELTDAYLGRDMMSLCFLNGILGNNANIGSKRDTERNMNECQPPEYVIPSVAPVTNNSNSSGNASSTSGQSTTNGSSGVNAAAHSNIPLGPLHPPDREGTPPKCLRFLGPSIWSPPPSNRRLHGDLLYLVVHTLEDRRYHITACTKGFFINQSTDCEYNPRPVTQQACFNHSLIDLLRQISPGFKRQFEILLRRRSQKHPFERIPCPYQSYSWLSPLLEHGADSLRREEVFCSKMAYEENLPGQTREWNEELQATRDLPRSSVNERLVRERAVFKSYSDFVAAATRAAMAVVNGNIMPINPGEDMHQQMYIWNNMFFSLGFDVKDHYKDFGGDAAAYAATASDLNGVRMYMNLDLEGIYTLGTAIIDYRGYRVTAQTIIPGILEKEQEHSVVYGSIDFGKTIVTHEKYDELLSQAASLLKIHPHKVLDSKGEEKLLHSSLECKGIIGNDKRHYVLDLLRSCPPDINFMPGQVPDDDVHVDIAKLGFPFPYKHNLPVLRQELVDIFVETRYMTFLRLVSIHFHQKKNAQMKRLAEEKENESENTGAGGDGADNDIKSLSDDKELEETKKMVEKVIEENDGEEALREVVAKAAKAVNSLSETKFDMSFNPDVYQDHVKIANPDGIEHQRDKELVRDICEFLVLIQIPRYIQDCLEHRITPCDGQALTESLHQNGINIRYLGKIAEMTLEFPTLEYLHNLCVSELIVRAAKHTYKEYLQSVDNLLLAPAIAHFLNCFLGSCPQPHTHSSNEEVLRLTKKRKNKKGKAQKEPENPSWMNENCQSLWKKLTQHVHDNYHFQVKSSDADQFCEQFGYPRVSLLRAFCVSVGIQLALRDYSIEQRSRPAFSSDDILNIYPVVKHLNPQASDAQALLATGQNRISQGALREAHWLIFEALNMYNQVYGPLHPDVVVCNRLLGRLAYVMGDYPGAFTYQQRAVLLSERVLGVDNPATGQEYSHLALYCFAMGQFGPALQLIYRARYIALLCHGEYHPEIPLIDTNIGLMLHAVEDYEKSLIFLQNALRLNIKFFGSSSLKVALSNHLVARTHSCRGDFRSALALEKDSYSIYKLKLGENNERTLESNECLRHLTGQAVVFAKRMQEINRGEARSFPPIHIQPPSLNNLVETLNLVNGIFVIQISPEDIERLQMEIKRSQEQSGIFLNLTEALKSQQ
jgi:protein TIF31